MVLKKGKGVYEANADNMYSTLWVRPSTAVLKPCCPVQDYDQSQLSK